MLLSITVKFNKLLSKSQVYQADDISHMPLTL